jgi:shikimate kinase
MNVQGMTFYLKANADQLLRNIQQDESKRPLLKDLKDDALLDYINTKLKEREHYYQMSQHIVTVNSNALSIFDAKIKQYV